MNIENEQIHSSFRNRYYNPRLGRFMSEDPIGILSGQLNTYTYIGNRALIYLDPYGLQSVQELIDIQSKIKDLLDQDRRLIEDGLRKKEYLDYVKKISKEKSLDRLYSQDVKCNSLYQSCDTSFLDEVEAGNFDNIDIEDESEDIDTSEKCSRKKK